jgi:hypothetical protein
MRSMAAADMSENYAGRVLQRSAFRSLVGRKRTPGTAISSVLTGIRKPPPQPTPAPAARASTAGAKTSGHRLGGPSGRS